MKRRFLAFPDGSASTFTAFKGDKSPPMRILDVLILHTRQPKMCKINKLKEEEGRVHCPHGYPVVHLAGSLPTPGRACRFRTRRSRAGLLSIRDHPWE